MRPTALYPEIKGAVPLGAWTYDIRNYDQLLEESQYMPYLNSALTILTIPYDEFEEELDEDDHYHA
jgi:hypothetical protein